MRIRLLFPILSAALFVSACHKAPPKIADIAAVLPNLPLPPNYQGLTREGGPDAMQFLFVTPETPDSIVNYYRNALSTGVFRLINETTKGKSTSFYAEQDGPSIWVTVSPNGDQGSQVLIAGATDSAGRIVHVPPGKPGDSGATAPLPVRKP